jgi:enoyl-CoA hydratase/carnithine racemase
VTDGALRTTRSGAVVTVTINIPPHNIVGAELVVGLFGLLPELEADESVAVVVFRSADPDFFLMHGDVEAILASTPSGEPVTEPNIAAALFERLHNAPFLTIGFLNGYARGGAVSFFQHSICALEACAQSSDSPRFRWGSCPERAAPFA